MLEKVTKTVISFMALSVLFWVFWNPSPKKSKSKDSKDKTELSAKKDKAKKSRARKNGKAKKATKRSKNKKRDALLRNDVAEGFGYLVVTGTVRSVRFRNPAGRIFGPGEIEPGQYDILSRTKGKVIEHGEITVKAGDRKRIDCDDDGCKLWKPKSK